MIPTLPKLNRAACQRIARIRTIAQLELQRNLTRYFRQVASSKTRWEAAHEDDLTTWITAYATTVYMALAREYSVHFAKFQGFRLFLEWRLPTEVLAEIWPKPERGRLPENPETKSTSVSGVVETAIQNAWIQASLKLSGQNSFQVLDQHRFQTSWRDPLIRDPITVVIRDTFKEKLSELLEVWQPRGGRKMKAHRRKADSGEAQTAIVISSTSIQNGSPQQSEGTRKRGRPSIPSERKEAALNVINKGGTLRDAAVILYATKRPSLQQVKSTSTVLKYYKNQLKPSVAPASEQIKPSRKTQ